jgi:hypothetical protein
VVEENCVVLSNRVVTPLSAMHVQSPMNWIFGGKAASGCAASASHSGRLRTRSLSSAMNFSAIIELSGMPLETRPRLHNTNSPIG